MAIHCANCNHTTSNCVLWRCPSCKTIYCNCCIRTGFFTGKCPCGATIRSKDVVRA